MAVRIGDVSTVIGHSGIEYAQKVVEEACEVYGAYKDYMRAEDAAMVYNTRSSFLDEAADTVVALCGLLETVACGDLQKRIKRAEERNRERGRELSDELISDYDSVMDDAVVDHPVHYAGNGIECIDAIRAALTDDEFRGFCKGNVIKYAWRERDKGKNEDLHKAAWCAEKATE